ncbi:hypothetical protein B7463_g1593, partial [Scytalidium lignicola]
MVHSTSGKMKAVRWEGELDSVSVKEIAIPRIRKPLDAIVRITSAAICGTDLHTYHGRIEMNTPLTFGHENIGIIEEVGSAVTTLKRGDRVVIAAGNIKADADDEPEFQTFFGIGQYGLPQMNGGQAQFMRVPNADDNFLLVPDDNEHELDYILLADIWVTAWYSLDCAGQVFGDTVAIFGAGPVGLLCAYSAILRGAIRVYVVDHVPERLARAKSIGAIPINFAHGDPVAQITKLEPDGVDRTCDCCGFECIDAEGENVENIIISQAVQVTKSGGGIGLTGVYPPHDIGATTKATSKGILSFPVGEFWLKGLSIKGGVITTDLYKPTQLLLKNLIERHNAKPSFVFDKEFRIEQAAEAFREFSEHKIIKGVFRFEKDSRNGESSVTMQKGSSIRDPLEGEPIRKRTRLS